MGNTQTTPTPKIEYATLHDNLINDRMLCREPRIAIGICGTNIKDKNNPFKLQKIKINDERLGHSLTSFSETDTSVTFEFEDNIKLQLMCISNGICSYHLKYPNKNIDLTRTIDPFLKDMYKPILFSSKELDKIDYLFKKCQPENNHE